MAIKLKSPKTGKKIILKKKAVPKTRPWKRMRNLA